MASLRMVNTLCHLPTQVEQSVGNVQFGFGVDDLAAFYAAREENGITFATPPEQRFRANVARFLDCEGAETSISA